MKDKIFLCFDKKYILKIFSESKGFFYFPKNKKIVDVKIEKVSPSWAKEGCLARYIILFSDNTREKIRGTAKKDESKKRVFNIMEYLYSRGFNKGHLQSAKPFYYVPSANLLLYKESPGMTLTQIIEEKNNKVVKKNLKNVAGWLVKLHNIDLNKENFPEAVFLGFKGYKRTFEKIKKFFPELKNNLIPIYKIKFIDRLWENKETLIHNDFYPGNTISNGRIIYGIDFDRAGKGPFLMDIAAFYGALEFPKEIWDSGFSKKKIRSFQKVFLKEYCKLKNLNYSETKIKLNGFLVKVFLDQVHYYTEFSIRGLNFMDKKTKDDFTRKIKASLIKTNEYLKKYKNTICRF